MKTIGLLGGMSWESSTRRSAASSAGSIGLLIGPESCSVPLFDTTEIHARIAALKALDEG